MAGSIIRIKEAKKTFGRVEALRGVDLEVAPVSYTHLTLPTILRV